MYSDTLKNKYLQGKIRVFKWTDGKFTPSFNYNQDNICIYYEAMKLFPKPIEADEKCVLKKVNYRLLKINYILMNSLRLIIFF